MIMAPASKDSPRFGVVSAGPVVLVVHLLGLAASIMMLFWNLHYRGGLAYNSTIKQQIFNIHPVLMFVGFIFIGGEGIVVHKMLPASKGVKKIIHMVLMVGAGVFAVLGLCSVYKYHKESGISDNYSLHSWLGLTTISLFALQWFSGFVTFLFPGLSTMRRTTFLPWHAFMGISVFLMAICTAEAGIMEKLTFLHLFRGGEIYLVNSMGLVILLYGILVGLCVVLY